MEVLFVFGNNNLLGPGKVATLLCWKATCQMMIYMVDSGVKVGYLCTAPLATIYFMISWDTVLGVEVRAQDVGEE